MSDDDRYNEGYNDGHDDGTAETFGDCADMVKNLQRQLEVAEDVDRKVLQALYDLAEEMKAHSHD